MRTLLSTVDMSGKRQPDHETSGDSKRARINNPIEEEQVPYKTKLLRYQNKQLQGKLKEKTLLIARLETAREADAAGSGADAVWKRRALELEETHAEFLKTIAREEASRALNGDKPVETEPETSKDVVDTDPVIPAQDELIKELKVKALEAEDLSNIRLKAESELAAREKLMEDERLNVSGVLKDLRNQLTGLTNERDFIADTARVVSDKQSRVINVLGKVVVQRTEELRAVQKIEADRKARYDNTLNRIRSERDSAVDIAEKFEADSKSARQQLESHCANVQEMQTLLVKQQEQLKATGINGISSESASLIAMKQEWSAKENAWLEKERDMKLLIDVGKKAAAGKIGLDMTELAAAKELAEAKLQDALKDMGTLDTLREELHEAQRSLEGQKGLIEFFESQMETMVKDHEEMQQMNVRLLASRSSVEATNVQLISERASREQTISSLERKNMVMEQRIDASNELMRVKQDALVAVQTQLRNMEKSLEKSSSNLSVAKNEILGLNDIARDATKVMMDYKSQAHSALQEVTSFSQQIASKNARIIDDDVRIRRLKEQIELADRKLLRAKKDRELGSEEELEYYRVCSI